MVPLQRMLQKFCFKDVCVFLGGLSDDRCSFVPGGCLNVNRRGHSEMVFFFPCAKGKEDKQWGA